MIRCAAALADAASAHSLDDLLVGNLDAYNIGDLHAHVVKRLRLRNGAREAVENESVFAVRLRQTLFDYPDNDLVEDERAGIDEAFCVSAHFGSRRDRLTDHVARRN